MLDIPSYTPRNWYWIVGGDETRFWSSAAGGYVGALPQGAHATQVESEAVLTAVLRNHNLPGPLPTDLDVKAEANRRIEAIMPDFKQRNALALGMETVMTYGADPANWPAEMQQINAATLGKWTAIKAIRTRSDEIEAMAPIPADFRDDSYWLT